MLPNKIALMQFFHITNKLLIALFYAKHSSQRKQCWANSIIKENMFLVSFSPVVINTQTTCLTAPVQSIPSCSQIPLCLGDISIIYAGTS